MYWTTYTPPSQQKVLQPERCKWLITTQTIYDMEEKILMDLLYQSMQDSAREARLSLGRPSSHATRQQALEQVAMLKAAKDRASREQK